MDEAGSVAVVELPSEEEQAPWQMERLKREADALCERRKCLAAYEAERPHFEKVFNTLLILLAIALLLAFLSQYF